MERDSFGFYYLIMHITSVLSIICTRAYMHVVERERERDHMDRAAVPKYKILNANGEHGKQAVKQMNKQPW